MSKVRESDMDALIQTIKEWIEDADTVDLAEDRLFKLDNVVNCFINMTEEDED